MSQISPPIRIVLAAALALVAAWFVLLRPGTEPVAPTQPAAAPGSGFGKAVQGAKDVTASGNAASAVAATEGNAPATGSATPSTGAKPAPAGSKANDEELKLPAGVARAMKLNATVVLLFWNKKAIDDRAVFGELAKIRSNKSLRGKVYVHVASIKDVARYASITRGVNLEQSPTIVVAKGDTADALVGYVDIGTIEQTISDVMRSSKKK